MAIVELNSEGNEVVKLRRDSPFSATDVLKDEATGDIFFDIWEPPLEYTPQRGDQIHTVTSADAGRPDLIAYKYYNNVRLYWVLMYVNRILHPINELTPGVKLIVPSRTFIRNFVTGV